ncbi:Mu-like prophage protein GP36 [Sulfuriferula multivorans]|uniref:Mu-like prophage protein GP36 n=1 Tax=Sulfuriferula multivorans TaxID=1559896 RepID=A0A401JF37_9PROT|nr:DUF1320 domain-containing protein [Sulfuriferula multivorans]GBL46226.1 Mu-like prophage protein GP36 [Sulfuriferula multivorans]
MAYTTQAEMVDAFGSLEIIQLTDRADPPLGAVDAAVLATALDDAAAEIDSYLVGRYTLPMSPAPSVLKRFNREMARYLLYKDAAPQEIADRYKSAIKFLTNVANGVASLGPDSVGQQAPGAVQYVANPSIFGGIEL